LIARKSGRVPEFVAVQGGMTALRDPLLRYGVALGITALAAILRGVLGAHFPGLVPFVTFFPAVLAVTLLAGLGPGLLATGLSAYLAWFFWLQPATELPPPATAVTLNLILFMLASVLLVVTAEAARRYHGRSLAGERRFRAAEDSAFDGFGILEAVRDPVGAIADFRWTYANPALVTALRAAGASSAASCWTCFRDIAGHRSSLRTTFRWSTPASLTRPRSSMTPMVSAADFASTP
jgi:Domain of unknown function (DUF4118)